MVILEPTNKSGIADAVFKLSMHLKTQPAVARLRLFGSGHWF